MEILKAERVYKLFPVKRNLLGRVTRWFPALRKVSVTVEGGKTLGVIGESGCGKSTLGKLLLDLEKPTKGRVLYKGKDIGNLRGREYREYRVNVQAVFQNPQSSLNPRMKVWEIVTEGLKVNYRLQKKELLNRARELLTQVGLPEDYAERYPHQLSGGQKQRVAIARAVALQPEVIVADEPTSALDVSVQAQIVNLFLRLQEELGLSYFFISHSIPVVSAISDSVAVMYKGFVVERGSKEQVLCSTAHHYTKLLKESIPPVKGEIPEPTGEEPEGGCPFYSRCPARRPECLSYDMEPVEVEPGHFVACINPV
ncbi:oligopeptide/dipeptide ABC transporter ATP-binding protein [Thermovibrio ammonificans]|jgi:oligopeptide/dipeptide ABC transporter ATP-binding protein|uniref:Oligopeptide/dipeptide ABC transporter, ATPase subunit n=1 Tax=Thermovibrio ammonificans (strain DSM 15698 / JCM 12110 / HB-1) TaxID=648996 RepID=E8T691_THEA1|nr:oligopeptide/dipeptide ABC transporter ATP-binding protein [Thermovibrio ammonificans]ADU96675.1 oligopeptide/dipeptide ABC transporter, ATPase subunit [Thermovibrio ammonificans HB-1]